MLSRVFLVTVLLFGLFSPAYSQNAQRVVPLVGSPLLPINSGNPVPVTGTLSATIGGFTPSGNYATLTANGSSARSALPSGSPTVVVAYNTGTTAVSCILGGSGVTATTNEDQIAPGGFFSYTVGTNTYLACIDQTGSASNVVVLSGGTGIATGSGGGGGSGSSGAVYGPTAAGSAAANPPVLMGGTVDGTSTGNVDNWKVASGLGYVLAVGAGTAGSASGGILTVQGVASMTPLLVNPNTIATWGLAAIGGTTGSPTNALAAGCQYNSSAPTFSTGDVGGVQCNVNGAVNVDVTNANANGQATMANSSPVTLASNQSVGDPCTFQAKTNATVFQTSSGTLITGTSGKKNYICSFTVGTSAAAEISLVEYSGTCTGGTAYAVFGSTTAADGWPLAANGGLTYGNGGGTIISGAGNTNTGYNVCLLQAGTANVMAQVTYVQQ